MAEETQSKKSSRKVYAVVLGIFALFGFFESLTAISTYFHTPEAKLTAEVYPSRGKFPRFFYSSLGPGFEENGRTFLNTLKATCGERPLDTEPTAFDVSFPNPESKKHFCKHVEDLSFASDQTEEAFVNVGTILDIEIQNTGTTRASGIKIPSGGILYLDAFKGQTHLKSNYNSDTSSYSLPDLNPGEKLRLEVWKRGSIYGYDTLYDFEIPEITFDGPPVSITTYSYVNEDVYGVSDFFSSLGSVFGIIFFLAICAIIGIGLLVIVALAEAFFKGKPLATVFQSPQKTEVNDATD